MDAATPSAAPHNILLAEDNSADVLLVRRALRVHGVECELNVVSDGEEAIAWLTHLNSAPNAPSLHLILLDMHLPKQDGTDILRYLRSTENYARTPVIVITSQDPAATAAETDGFDAVSHFRKPSSLDEFMQLGSIVSNILAGRAPMTQKHSGGQP